MGWAARLKTWLKGYLYPSGVKCIACSTELDRVSPEGICHICLKELHKKAKEDSCKRCAAHLHAGTVCPECATMTPVFDRTVACYEYDATIKKLVIAAKDFGKLYLYKYFARNMADAYIKSGLKADIVTYVPSDKDSRQKRGAEVNEILSREFCALTDMSAVRALDRIAKPDDQTRLTKGQRFANIAGNFKPSADVLNELAGKTVLLIDDVMTTGATAGECARTLKNELKVAEVIVVVYGRTELRRE